MLPVLTPAQARAWDDASAASGVAPATLMDAAGRAAAVVVAHRFGGRCREGVLVAAGRGNNGGDGWVLARALHAAGVPVWVAALAGETAPLAAAAAALARADGVRDVAPDGPWPAPGILVDAILGTGASGAPRDAAAALAARLTDLDRPIVALDGPTGLDLADGVSHGPLRATLTITFGGYRRGHLLARDDCGDLVVVDAGFTRPDAAWPVLLTTAAAAGQLAPFPVNAHKGSRGRVVIVGGAPGMTGAARLAARAAFQAGAGLVHLLAPADSVPILAAAEPDVQVRPLDFGAALDAEAKALLARAEAVVIGPGMGRTDGLADLVVAVVGAARAVVLDADGLVAMKGRVADLLPASAGRPLVLTPHLGEFRSLFPDLASRAAVDPWAAAEEAAGEAGATLLLKGVPTVVAHRGHATVTVAAGNPGLATGGSGDCLAGMAASFLAQGLGPREAASVAAQALGEAADLAARRAPARSLRPMDVLMAIPDLWREWARWRDAPPLAAPPVLHELPLPRRA